jgi:hypothetical protein
MNFCLLSIQGWQYVVIIKLDFLTFKQSTITFASQSTISLIPILSSQWQLTITSFLQLPPRTLSLPTLAISMFLPLAKLTSWETCSLVMRLVAVTAFNTANTDFIRLNDERNLAQALFDAANIAFDTVTTTRITTRLKRDNAHIALEPAQARYELDRKHTLEHIVLQLQRAGARQWVHVLGNSTLELFTLALRFIKDFLRHPDPCAQVVRSHRIGIAPGNHRVGPMFTNLALHNIILCAGTGANLVSGLHPQCIRLLAIKPRLLANVGANSDQLNRMIRRARIPGPHTD